MYIAIMLINKVTEGFVIQVFDTDKGEYISQAFTAAGPVNYESTDGQTPLDLDVAGEKWNFGPEAEAEPYLPFDMLQPAEIPFAGQQLGMDVCSKCGSDYQNCECPKGNGKTIQLVKKRI